MKNSRRTGDTFIKMGSENCVGSIGESRIKSSYLSSMGSGVRNRMADSNAAESGGCSKTDRLEGWLVASVLSRKIGLGNGFRIKPEEFKKMMMRRMVRTKYVKLARCQSGLGMSHPVMLGRRSRQREMTKFTCQSPGVESSRCARLKVLQSEEVEDEDPRDEDDVHQGAEGPSYDVYYIYYCIIFIDDLYCFGRYVLSF